MNGGHVHPPVVEDRKQEARRRGLRNLFLPKLSELPSLKYLAGLAGGYRSAILGQRIAVPRTGTGHNRMTMNELINAVKRVLALVPDVWTFELTESDVDISGQQRDLPLQHNHLGNCVRWSDIVADMAAEPGTRWPPPDREHGARRRSHDSSK